MDSLDTSNSVGIDLGILNCIHTSDWKPVEWVGLEHKYERLRREQRRLSRNSWPKTGLLTLAACISIY